MAGEPTDGLIREIDEALRQEKLQQFFRLFGRYIIILSAVILLATGGYVWWKSHIRSSYEQQTTKLHDAIFLVEEGKSYRARSMFNELAKNSEDSIALLAGLWQVKLKYMAGKKEEAAEIAQNLEKKYGSNDEYAFYTDWLKMHTDPEAKNTTYHLSTQEMKAISLIQEKNYQEASVLLQQMLNAADMPDTMRDRTKKLLSYSKRFIEATSETPSKPTEERTL
jgi:hypothetical protein